MTCMTDNHRCHAHTHRRDVQSQLIKEVETPVSNNTVSHDLLMSSVDALGTIDIAISVLARVEPIGLHKLW